MADVVSMVVMVGEPAVCVPHFILDVGTGLWWCQQGVRLAVLCCVLCLIVLAPPCPN